MKQNKQSVASQGIAYINPDYHAKLKRSALSVAEAFVAKPFETIDDVKLLLSDVGQLNAWESHAVVELLLLHRYKREAVALEVRSDYRETINSLQQSLKKYRADRARGGRSKSPNKAQALAEIERQWNAWQAGRMKFPTNEAFAREMVHKFPVFRTVTTITRACTRWDRARRNRAG